MLSRSSAHCTCKIGQMLIFKGTTRPQSEAVLQSWNLTYNFVQFKKSVHSYGHELKDICCVTVSHYYKETSHNFFPDNAHICDRSQLALLYCCGFVCACVCVGGGGRGGGGGRPNCAIVLGWSYAGGDPTMKCSPYTWNTIPEECSRSNYEMLTVYMEYHP